MNFVYIPRRAGLKVLFLSSHELGRDALDLLKSYDGWSEIAVKVTDRLDPYPDEYDLGISFLYNYLIPKEQLTPTRTWVNFHPALLPDYRGRNVGYHAIMNGAKVFGATLHYVDATFDTGDIIAISCFSIGEGDTAGDITKRARETCLEMFTEYIPRLLKGELPISVRQGEGKYYSLTPIDPYIQLTAEQQREVRAITAPPYFAKTMIGGKEYAIVPAGELHHPDDEPSGSVGTSSEAIV